MFIEVTPCGNTDKIIINTEQIEHVDTSFDITSIYMVPRSYDSPPPVYNVQESYTEIKSLLECNDLILHKKIKGI